MGISTEKLLWITLLLKIRLPAAFGIHQGIRILIPNHGFFQMHRDRRARQTLKLITAIEFLRLELDPYTRTHTTLSA